MAHYVYELRNESNNVLYVGESAKPGQRIYFHRGNRKSKVYGQKFEMVIVGEFQTEKEAYNYQCELQTKYGLVTDRQKMARSGEENPKTKLTNEIVKQIRAQYVKGKGAELGRKYGVSRMVIGRIMKNESYSNL
jgi:predicted GIY-YIG superfamily endonuclease